MVDATGAGDAFNGGFIFEWLRNAPLEQCLQTGNACGAAAVQGRSGTGGLKSLPDILAINSPDLLMSKAK